MQERTRINQRGTGHLDYDHQRRIMKMIKASASSAQSTVIVATHSLNLIDGVDIQDIVHLHSRDGRAYVQSLGTGNDDKEARRFLSNMAVSLGFRNSVLLHERCFVGVEGATEYAALPALFRLAYGYPHPVRRDRAVGLRRQRRRPQLRQVPQEAQAHRGVPGRRRHDA